jgi:Concanavalin A-like lectin/glucanases superfamily/PEP-CTERM motif
MFRTKSLFISGGFIAGLFLLGTSSSHAGLATGLEAYYQFNGNGLDSSGNGLNLTLAGSPSFGPGLFGQALSLDNNPSQYAILSADPTAFNFGSNDFTIQVWVNFNTFGSDIQTLIEKFTGAGGPGWSLTAINNSLQFYADGLPAVNSSAVSITTGTWNQIVVARQGTTLDIYLNDSLVASDSSYVGAITTSSLPLLIGNRNSEDGRNYDVNGSLDEIALWNRALSTSEIASLWNNGAGAMINVSSVPEPSTLMLAAAALVLLGVRGVFVSCFPRKVKIHKRAGSNPAMTQCNATPRVTMAQGLAPFRCLPVMAILILVSIASQAKADFLVAGFGSNNVVSYNQTTGASNGAFVTSGSGGLSGPVGMTFGPDGDLYVTGINNSSVLRYNDLTGAFLGDFTTGPSLSGAVGLTFHDANLFVASQATNTVQEFNGTTGAFIPTFVTSGSGGLDGLNRIAFGPDRNVYASSGGTNSLLEYNETTCAFLKMFASCNGLSTPNGLPFGSDGALYVANSGGGDIERFNATTGVFEGVFVTASSGGLSQPTDMVFGPDGNLYVSGFGNNAVWVPVW